MPILRPDGLTRWQRSPFAMEARITINEDKMLSMRIAASAEASVCYAMLPPRVLFTCHRRRARSSTDPGGAPAARPPQLPITQVVLFSSGVGYFQREGEVEGNARVDLTFPVTDINDLLKSMVLQDLDGGHISAVSYDSHDPVERTLQVPSPST